MSPVRVSTSCCFFRPLSGNDFFANAKNRAQSQFRIFAIFSQKWQDAKALKSPFFAKTSLPPYGRFGRWGSKVKTFEGVALFAKKAKKSDCLGGNFQNFKFLKIWTFDPRSSFCSKKKLYTERGFFRKFFSNLLCVDSFFKFDRASKILLKK